MPAGGGGGGGELTEERREDVDPFTSGARGLEVLFDAEDTLRGGGCASAFNAVVALLLTLPSTDHMKLEVAKYGPYKKINASALTSAVSAPRINPSFLPATARSPSFRRVNAF